MKVTSNSNVILGMMPSRSRDLNYASNGWEQTHTSLVGMDESGAPIFLGAFDDPGIYFLFPKIAALLSCDVVLVARCFYLLVVITATLLIYLGFKKGAKSTLQKISLLVVCFLLFSLNLVKSDVYTFSYMGVATIPIALQALKTRNRYWYVVICITVILAFVLNFFRSHSGTIILLFLSLYLLFVLKNWKHTFVYFAMVVLLWFSNYFITKQIAETRNNWFEKNTSISIDESLSHPFWHSAYIGLGFIPNTLGLAYNDQIAIDKVNAIHPGVLFCGKVYESTLKQEYFQVLKTQTAYFIKVHLIKFLIILIIVLILLNYQIKKIIKFRIQQSALLPFALTIAFAALPALIVVPRINYLNALITLSLVWYVYLICVTETKSRQSKV